MCVYVCVCVCVFVCVCVCVCNMCVFALIIFHTIPVVDYLRFSLPFPIHAIR